MLRFLIQAFDALPGGPLSLSSVSQLLKDADVG